MPTRNKLFTSLSLLLALGFIPPINSGVSAQTNDLSEAELLYKQLIRSNDMQQQRLAQEWKELAKPQHWTDSSGVFQTKGRFQEYDAKTNKVTLLLTKETTIALDKLDEESQNRVRQILALTAKMKQAGRLQHESGKAPDFVIYVSPQGSGVAQNLQDLLQHNNQKISAVITTSLPKAVATDAGVLLIFLPEYRDVPSNRLIEDLKKRKIIGVGAGAAKLFGHMGLLLDQVAQIRKHDVAIRLESSRTLGTGVSVKAIQTYKNDTESDDFGMHIPEASEQRQFVDVIARAIGDENYAPIVSQSNCVSFGISAPPKAWSAEYTDLFRQVAMATLGKETIPFELPQYTVLSPGNYKLMLARALSTKEAYSKKYHFKFKAPTRFTANLQHNGSNNMMLIFMGDGDRLHWTRKDASSESGSAGEDLRIVVNITAEDLRRHGDKYWTLGVTNFDRADSASCLLNVQYNTD